MAAGPGRGHQGSRSEPLGRVLLCGGGGGETGITLGTDSPQKSHFSLLFCWDSEPLVCLEC